MTDSGPSGGFDPALARWVQARHLLPDAVADLRHRFHASPERYLVIDDFLVPEHPHQMRRVLLEDGIIETVYKIYETREWVTKEQFDDAADDQRFIHEGIYVRPHADKRMSPAVLTDLLFRKAIQGAAFHHWLRAITGRPVDRTGQINLKKLHKEHMLRWHSDGVKGRVLCAVLYLHDDWRAEYGGRLLMQRRDGGIDAIDPLFNRLVLFDPQSKIDHAVEPMTAAAGDWARLNYTAWFYQKDAPAA
ncbi:2OG-Fe(II) oxygenase [Azospirillum sp. B4]|uniref:2OG-Fe(II) oxygenase n=1 Tax=Azospirillum sp. B4 TaxID=95605 RepID=UPI000346A885|nr:2OG-Fe(II) oxygenase [Azospirillum sp. B4]